MGSGHSYKTNTKAFHDFILQNAGIFYEPVAGVNLGPNFSLDK
jgi:hypothetical protein